MRAPRYVVRNRFGIYYFRIAVPKRLRNPITGLPKEIRRSLRTSILREALTQARLLWAEFYQVFRMDADSMNDIDTDLYENEMNDDENNDAGESRSLFTDEEKQRFVQEYESNIFRLRAKKIAEPILRKEANQARLDAELRKLGVEPESLKPLPPSALPVAPISANLNATVSAPESPGATVKEVLNQFLAEKIQSGQWKEKSREENEAIYNIFLRIVGDVPFRTLKYAELRRYKETIQKLPPNLNNAKRFEGRSIEEVLALGLKPISTVTLNKHLSRMGGLFDWAERHDFTDRNYARGLVVKGAKSMRRDVLNEHDLALLFGTDEYTGKKRFDMPHKFWVPLLALYTGARLEEVCQLTTSDVIDHEGIWCISINDEGEKQTKTESSNRIVPLHSTLLGLGFLKMVKNRGEGRIFPEIKPTKGRLGHDVSSWFGNYRKSVGVTSRKKVFHSFRHTVMDNLEQQGVEAYLIKAIVGHSRKDVTGRSYGKRKLPPILKPVVEQLSYKIDLESLRRGARCHI
jgi:integrase